MANRSTSTVLALNFLALSLGATLVFPSADARAQDKQAIADEIVQIEQEISALRGQPDADQLMADLMNQRSQLVSLLGGWNSVPTPSAQPAAGGTPRGGPIAPPACTADTLSASAADTPLAVTSNASTTSTLTVSGAAPLLYDIEVITDITHTWAGDLEITLQSPAGTVVTLSTDNGGGSDDVFSGTTWSDRANPGGQVPYTSNDGVVTDHAYSNLTTATPLVPEEAMSAFKGEDPNGVWTLTVHDDAGGDTGTLNGWSVNLTTLASPFAAVTTGPIASTDTPIAIPSTAPPTVISSTINVAGADNFLTDVELFTDIAHTWNDDLDITLQSPAGTLATLTTDNGGGNDNVFAGTTWSDDANPGGQVPYTTNDGLVTDRAYVNDVAATPLVPEEAFGVFAGEDPNGDWVLTISDDANLDGGSLDAWSLSFTTGACSADLVVTKSGPAAATAGGQATYSIEVTNNGPSQANNVSVGDTPPAGFTFNSGTAPCGGGFACNLGTLDPGDSVQFDATFDIDPSAPTGDVDNTATVTSDTPDPDAANDTATATTTLGADADLMLTKTASTQGVAEGDQFDYTLTVENAGPSTATGVVITDNLPPSQTLVASSGCAEDPAGAPTCTVGTLTPGQSAVVTLTVEAGSAVGEVINTASASSAASDSVPANNQGSAGVVSVIAVPSLRALGIAGLLAALLLSGLVWLRRSA
jgi:uncharacterized repeat protein (TIGR01451 family)